MTWASRWRWTLVAAVWSAVNLGVAILHSQGGLW